VTDTPERSIEAATPEDVEDGAGAIATSTVAQAIAMVASGGVAVIPTDTVYGLVADGHSERSARALYALKGRDDVQPTALVLARTDLVLELLPELPASVRTVVEALLPGPFTLVLSNPERRFAWLTGERATLGVRVPDLGGPGGDVLRGTEVLVATSANLPGGPDPRSLEDVPADLRDRAGAVVDGGVLPGIPSTVIDLTGESPVVLRVGAVPEDVALARVAAASGR
jgi:L-threonylcarbamoyladenylate synthase